MTKSPIEQAIESIERGKEMVSQFAEPEAILDDPEEYCGTDDGPETLCMVFDNMRHQALTGYENALTALRQHQQDGGWLPIESAPRDGTNILLYGGDWIFEARWQDEKWFHAYENDDEPTHWCHKPPPPQKENE